MVNCDNKGDGRAVLFESKDGFSWNFKSILAQNNGKYGKMWECPDLFEPVSYTHLDVYKRQKLGNAFFPFLLRYIYN